MESEQASEKIKEREMESDRESKEKEVKTRE